MGEQEKTTLATIHKAATAEFLEKGFKSASLRNIVKTAGVSDLQDRTDIYSTAKILFARTYIVIRVTPVQCMCR